MRFAIRFTQWNAGFFSVEKKSSFSLSFTQRAHGDWIGRRTKWNGANEPSQWNTIKTPLRIH